MLISSMLFKVNNVRIQILPNKKVQKITKKLKILLIIKVIIFLSIKRKKVDLI